MKTRSIPIGANDGALNSSAGATHTSEELVVSADSTQETEDKSKKHAQRKAELIAAGYPPAAADFYAALGLGIITGDAEISNSEIEEDHEIEGVHTSLTETE